jgi:multiple sugar transport system ATP-binding protein
VAIEGGPRIAVPLGAPVAPGTRLSVGVRPQHVTLANADGIPASVRLSEALGSETVIHAEVGGQKTLAVIQGQHHLSPGDRIHLSFAGAPLHVFGEDGLRR